jgi:hypothetical protein
MASIESLPLEMFVMCVASVFMFDNVLLVCKKWKQWIDIAPRSLVKESKNRFLIGYSIQQAINKGDIETLLFYKELVADWSAFSFKLCPCKSLKFALKNGLKSITNQYKFLRDDLAHNIDASMNNYLYFTHKITYDNLHITKEIFQIEIANRSFEKLVETCEYNNRKYGVIFDFYRNHDYQQYLNYGLSSKNLYIHLFTQNIFDSHLIFPKKETLQIANSLLASIQCSTAPYFVPLHLTKDDTENLPALEFVRAVLDNEIVDVVYDEEYCDTYKIVNKQGVSQVQYAVFWGALAVAVKTNCLYFIEIILKHHIASTFGSAVRHFSLSLEVFQLFCKYCTNPHIFGVLMEDVEKDTDKKNEKIALIPKDCFKGQVWSYLWQYHLFNKERILQFYGKVLEIIYQNEYICVGDKHELVISLYDPYILKKIKSYFPYAFESHLSNHSAPELVRGIKL